MCGICGVYTQEGISDADRALLPRMCQALVHRGPDDEGVYLDEHAALGSRRLKIIDLSGGHQPISNEDETLWIVFNGEIYNYRELREQLVQGGHHFRTCSDTETIVHAYEEYGEQCVEHLAGMFAFALWDQRRQRLFAARDRLGKKPFYYAWHGQRLVFGSELKALMCDASLRLRLEPAALHHYLTLQYVPDPLSIYQGIFKLPPAHILTCDASGLRLRRYWDVAYRPKLQISEAEAMEELRRLLGRAVNRRLISEVPLGAFLSGGLDSSIVVGLMAQQSAQAVKTFSIGFKDRSFNELPYARAVAQKWNTQHHEFIVDSDCVADNLPRLAATFDEPFADTSALLTYYLAQMTRQYVTVALSGDGGDETFAGYPRYWMDSYVRPYTALPNFVTQTCMPRLLSVIPEPTNVIIEANWIAGLKRLAQVARISPKASIIRWGSFFNEELKAELYTSELRAALASRHTADGLAQDFDRAQADSFLDRTLYVDLMNYLPGNGLVKVDRLTMAHSLEARQPFLDHEYVEFTARLPEHWKLRGRTGKYLLKKAFAAQLPPELLRRPKRGFAPPVETWLKHDLRPLVHDLLLSPNARLRAYCAPASLARLIDEHERSVANHGRRLWALLVLEQWLLSTASSPPQS